MPTTFTNIWRLAVLAPLDPATLNSWGAFQDATMPLMEQGAVGITAVNIAGLTTFSLTTANNSTDQARFLVQSYTGALANNCTVTIPNLAKIGWAQNSTTGGFNVILSAGGLTATIPPDGQWYLFAGDGGTNVQLVPVGFGSVHAASGITVASGGLTVASGGLTVTGIVGNMTFFSTNTDPAGNGTNGLAVQGSTLSAYSGSTGGTVRIANAASPTGPLIEFFNGATANVGNISTNGATTSYNTTSDERLKINDGKIERHWATNIIDRLTPRMFRWKTKPDHQSEPGFFAQEVDAIYSWAITKGSGEPGDEDFHPWKIDANKLMPVVISALQALRDDHDTQQKELQALRRRLVQIEEG